MKEKDIEVVQDEKDPIPAKVMAQAIIDIANAAKKMESSGLNRRAILVLLKDASGASMTNIERVLNAQKNLTKYFLS